MQGKCEMDESPTETHAKNEVVPAERVDGTSVDWLELFT